MANPTGSTYLHADPAYVWADGDVYLIPQSDLVEAAAPGASFGGQGVANQPHQLLLNKIQQIYAKQLTDEATLAAIPLSMTSNVGTNGWLKMSVGDEALGGIQMFLQWGTIPITIPPNPVTPYTNPVTFNFPRAFPNAVWILSGYWQSSVASPDNHTVNVADAEALLPLQLFSNTFTWAPANLVPTISGSVTLLSSIGWVALGY